MKDIIELLESLSSKYKFDEEDNKKCRELIYKLENGDQEITIIDENVKYPDPDELEGEEDNGDD